MHHCAAVVATVAGSNDMIYYLEIHVSVASVYLAQRNQLKTGVHQFNICRFIRIIN